jgi:hypothetical protein
MVVLQIDDLHGRVGETAQPRGRIGEGQWANGTWARYVAWRGYRDGGRLRIYSPVVSSVISTCRRADSTSFETKPVLACDDHVGVLCIYSISDISGT